MKKGITPVVAIIMLLLIVISLVGGMFVWMRRTMGGVQKTVGNQTEQQTKKMTQTVSIEAINCGDGEIYVRNTGSSSIPKGDLSVFVNDDLKTAVTYGSTPINPQDTITVSGLSFTSGNKYTVRVVAPGNEDELTKTC